MCMVLRLLWYRFYIFFLGVHRFFPICQGLGLGRMWHLFLRILAEILLLGVFLFHRTLLGYRIFRSHIVLLFCHMLFLILLCIVFPIGICILLCCWMGGRSIRIVEPIRLEMHLHLLFLCFVLLCRLVCIGRFVGRSLLLLWSGILFLFFCFRFLCQLVLLEYHHCHLYIFLYNHFYCRFYFMNFSFNYIRVWFSIY